MTHASALNALRSRIKRLENEHASAVERGAVRSSSTPCYEWANGRRLVDSEALDELLGLFDNDIASVLRFVKVNLSGSDELARLEPAMVLGSEGKMLVRLVLPSD